MKKKYIYDFWYLKPRLNFNIPVIFDIFRKNYYYISALLCLLRNFSDDFH